MKKILLSIAGYDPSGGAGVLLDVRVFESLGFQGMAVPTALVLQNTLKVTGVVPVEAKTLRKACRTLADDVSFSGIKIGMLGTSENVAAAAAIVRRHPGIPSVVDPVFVSSSGVRLLKSGGAGRLLEAFRNRAALVTPNLDEASRLSGMVVDSSESMREAARRIFGVSGIPCLVKGGHLKRGVMDILYDGVRTALYEHPRLRREVHGTGCFLSSSILAFLASGRSLESACALATDFAHKAIREAERPGRGRWIFTFQNK